MARRFVRNRSFSRRPARSKARYGWVTRSLDNLAIPVSETTKARLAIVTPDDWRANPLLTQRATLVAVRVDLDFAIRVNAQGAFTDTYGYQLTHIRHAVTHDDVNETNTGSLADPDFYNDQDVLHFGITRVEAGIRVTAGNDTVCPYSIWAPKLTFVAKTSRRLEIDSQVNLSLENASVFNPSPVLNGIVQANGLVRSLIRY